MPKLSKKNHFWLKFRKKWKKVLVKIFTELLNCRPYTPANKAPVQIVVQFFASWFLLCGTIMSRITQSNQLWTHEKKIIFAQPWRADTISLNHRTQPSHSTISLNYLTQPSHSTILLNHFTQPSHSTILLNHLTQLSHSTIALNHLTQPSHSTISLNHLTQP
jgi:hypothetical protein